MQLGITIPMERFFKMKKPPYGDKLNDLFCWDLHVVLLQGRPSVISVNCATRFSFVLAGTGAEEKDSLMEQILQEMENSFHEMGLSAVHWKRYKERAGAGEFTKTHGRSQVAYLNKAVDLMMWNDIAVDSASARQPVLNDILNKTPTRCAGDPEMEPPVDRLLEKLEKL